MEELKQELKFAVGTVDSPDTFVLHNLYLTFTVFIH